MSKLQWTPWHKVVKLRDDIRSGELSLATFAADLYDVVTGKAKPVYQDPGEFFSLTYPTFNLRELAKDVIQRLAGKNDKAVRQLELTYGGGKTHSLITFYHLTRDPENLPDLPSVREFAEHAGMRPPKARIAVIAFDKLDVEKGMEIVDPEGKTRWLKHPWSVLAWQIAGSDGLRLLHADGRDEERETAPAENLVRELLALPEKSGLATLVLLDEVLMYAREKIGMHEEWRSRLQNFFQYLTQAATKVDRCAVVASLLATDPGKRDLLGQDITRDFYAIFRREREEGVQPVVKEDVAEVLRRRFFAPDSIRDREAFRARVVSALHGISSLDEQTRKDKGRAEDRFLASYPFHPDLTEVFYAKWTNLEGFQRTRGVLRTFALALRDSEKWGDESPLVGCNVFLTPPDREDISEGLRELTTIAALEEYEGKRQEWSAILGGELEKARGIQSEFPGIKHREIEQAVIATFLHSQPTGHKALTRELMVLLGHTRPDKIELEKALKRWTEVSWFLDEASAGDIEGSGNELPKSWRLGSKPNLKQMHYDACSRVSDDLIEERLINDISKLKSLTAGAPAAGAKVHNLPARPRDIEDDGEFHYAILGPNTASASGKPSAEATRFLEETTSPDKPRVNKNSVVLVVPSRDGLEIVRTRIREYLGWEEVRNMLGNQQVDTLRLQLLDVNIEAAKKKIPDAVRQAYCICVTVSAKGEIQAYKLSIDDEPLFNIVKKDSRSRIQDTAITADTLMPGGPYDLWREGETSRRVKDLVGAFAQFPHLPKMLNQKAIFDTLVDGCLKGIFLLLMTRPDRSVRTYWRERPDEAALKDPGLEVVLPEAGSLTDLSPDLLKPRDLFGLWKSSEIAVRDLYEYFSGNNVVQVMREGYEEPVRIPKAEKEVINAAIRRAVLDGKLWMISSLMSVLAEEIPPGMISDDAQLQAQPAPIPPTDLLRENLPEAWTEESVSALTLALFLSKKAGKTLPWAVVREAIDGALRMRLLERTADSGQWPCIYAEAKSVKLSIPSGGPTPPPPPPPPPPNIRIAESELEVSEIQSLYESISDIKSAAVGQNLKFRLRIELGGGEPPPPDNVVERINALLKEVSANLKLR